MIIGKKDKALIESLKEERLNLLQHLSAANQEIANLQLIIAAKDDELKEKEVPRTPRYLTPKRTTKVTNSTGTRRKKTE